MKEEKKENTRVMATISKEYWKRLKYYATEKEIPLKQATDEALKIGLEKLEKEKK